tara:strand:+ start:545 stop:850 length:306 start_codon:yes stop_codon:yes gene_type:complete
MHGHNWKVEIEVSGDKLNNIGMVMDFKDIKNSAKKIGKNLDHRYLNDLEYFKTMNPTAENIAEYFYIELSKTINTDNIKVESIKLWETDRSAVRYTREDNV